MTSQGRGSLESTRPEKGVLSKWGQGAYDSPVLLVTSVWPVEARPEF